MNRILSPKTLLYRIQAMNKFSSMFRTYPPMGDFHVGWTNYVLTGWLAMVQVDIGISHSIYLADSKRYTGRVLFARASQNRVIIFDRVGNPVILGFPKIGFSLAFASMSL